jgi:hypothetical protein
MDKVRPRSFDRDLEEAKHWERKVSEELDEILVEEALRLASRAEQRNGIDITVKLKKATYDVKFRDRRYYLRGLLIETISVVEKNVPGWFYTSKADAVVYLWWNEAKTDLMPIGYYIYIQNKKLREWFEENKLNYKPQRSKTKWDDGLYHTEFYVIPIKDFPKGTIREFKLRRKSWQHRLNSFFKGCE